MSLRRPLIVAGAVLSIGVVVLVGCSSSKDSSSSTTTASGGSTSESAIGGNVTAPVVLTPDDPTATVKVGQVVTFDMGEPDGGTFVARSGDPAVFQVTSEGRTDGSATFNAGGKAIATGTAEVAVQFKGSTNGLGTPTTFTITVE